MKVEILQEEGLRREIVHSSVHQASCSEAILVARIRPGRLETRRELQRAARNPKIAETCMTLVPERV